MAVEWTPEEFIAKVKAAVMVGIVNGAEDVREEALRSMVSDPKTGRIYRRGSRLHQASAPGESPARDTGRLVASVQVLPEPAELRAVVNAGTQYSAFLEFGTRNMAARPFMRPALYKMAPKFVADIQRRLTEALK